MGNSVKLGHKEMVCEDMDCINLVLDRVQRCPVVNTVMELLVP
jgi:hypothetical protein